MKYSSWIKQLSVREQASLLGGADFWHTVPMDRCGIPSVMLSDGPTGLRKMNGIRTIKSVCYPSATAAAASFDKDALHRLGETLGEECLQERVSVLLGPGINIKRSPLCGRNFEYYSEDPVLAGELAANYIDGVQSKGVGTSMKHFAANSTEIARMLADSIVDERALHEIYLRGFEIAVRKAQPWTIMAAYNKVNGAYCTENKYLLTDILRGKWGFEGLVVSDWTAVSDRVAALKAGLDLEMPGAGNYSIDKLAKAYRAGEITDDDLQTSATRVLDLVDKALPALKTAAPKFSKDEHHQVARELAAGCPVLLKNGGNVLPLKASDRVAVIGARAKNPLIQGAGSAQINTWKVDTPWQALERELQNLSYAEGYSLTSPDNVNAGLTADAVAAAKAAEKVLLFVSSRPEDACEGTDRADMKLPAAMNALVAAVCEANPNTAVILTTGSAVELPWADCPDAILQTYLLGEAFGTALADLLMGRVSPSGKLPESYPKAYEDTPCPECYQPDKNLNLIYKESIFVGYRYYEKSGTAVQYPFGYGLSYTTFAYSNLALTTKKFNADDEGAKLVVKFDVTNTGSVDGAEAPQIYVAAPTDSLVPRPCKELKEFTKVFLKAGETKTVTVILDKSAFEYFSAEMDRWAVEPGTYGILVGSSSADIRLEENISVTSADDLSYEADYRSLTPAYYAGNIRAVDEEEFLDVLGYDLNDYLPDPEDRRLTKANCIAQAAHTKHGAAVNNVLGKGFDMVPLPASLKAMARDTILYVPINKMVATSRGLLSDDMADAVAHYLNDGSLSETVKVFALGTPATLKNLLWPWLRKRMAKKDIL